MTQNLRICFCEMPHCGENAREYLQKIFEKKVAEYCIAKGFIRKKTIIDRLGWKNTGFSVYMESVIEFTIYKESEKEKLEKMLRYVSKPFYSMQKIIFVENTDTVLYRRPKVEDAVKCAVKYAL